MLSEDSFSVFNTRNKSSVFALLFVAVKKIAMLSIISDSNKVWKGYSCNCQGQKMVTIHEMPVFNTRNKCSVFLFNNIQLFTKVIHQHVCKTADWFISVYCLNRILQ